MRSSFVSFAGVWVAFAFACSLTACSSADRLGAQLSATFSAGSNAHLVTSSAVAAKPSPHASASSRPAADKPAGSEGRSVQEASSGTNGAVDSDAAQPASDHPFDPGNPSIGGIALGMSEKDVLSLMGKPSQQYDLPIGDESVRMNEYDRMTVGYGSLGTVVYAEISAAGARTGIPGVQIGSEGQAAAAALGLPFFPDSQVLSCPVTGGLLKIDLAPDTQRVLSVKLVEQL